MSEWTLLITTSIQFTFHWKNEWWLTNKPQSLFIHFVIHSFFHLITSIFRLLGPVRWWEPCWRWRYRYCEAVRAQRVFSGTWLKWFTQAQHYRLTASFEIKVDQCSNCSDILEKRFSGNDSIARWRALLTYRSAFLVSIFFPWERDDAPLLVKCR